MISYNWIKEFYDIRFSWRAYIIDCVKVWIIVNRLFNSMSCLISVTDFTSEQQKLKGKRTWITFLFPFEKRLCFQNCCTNVIRWKKYMIEYAIPVYNVNCNYFFGNKHISYLQEYYQYQPRSMFWFTQLIQYVLHVYRIVYKRIYGNQISLNQFSVLFTTWSIM